VENGKFNYSPKKGVTSNLVPWTLRGTYKTGTIGGSLITEPEPLARAAHVDRIKDVDITVLLLFT